MKPPPFQYHDPKTVSEAVNLLGTLENAKLLAGGQSLMPMLNFRFVLPDHVIDLNRIAELSYIREKDGALEIGAMTRQRDLEFSGLVKAKCPLLWEGLQHTGHRQTRNRGTIGARYAISTHRLSRSRSVPPMTRPFRSPGQTARARLHLQIFRRVI